MNYTCLTKYPAKAGTKPQVYFDKISKMNLKQYKYSIILLIILSCGKQGNSVQNYGYAKNENKSSTVSLNMSDFKNYGMLIDRIKEIKCHDSIPKIEIRQKHLTKNIFPIEYCESVIFDPDGKHYVTFRNGKPYVWRTMTEIKSNSLSKKLVEDFSYYKKSKIPENYLIIIESERNERIDGIEKFIDDVTLAYDPLETQLELNFAFWEAIPPIQP